MNRTEWSLLSPCHTVTNAALQRNNEICNILAPVKNQRFCDLCALPCSCPFLSVHVGEHLLFIIILVCCCYRAPKTWFGHCKMLSGAFSHVGAPRTPPLWLRYWVPVLARCPEKCLVTWRIERTGWGRTLCVIQYLRQCGCDAKF